MPEVCILSLHRSTHIFQCALYIKFFWFPVGRLQSFPIRHPAPPPPARQISSLESMLHRAQHTLAALLGGTVHPREATDLEHSRSPRDCHADEGEESSAQDNSHSLSLVNTRVVSPVDARVCSTTSLSLTSKCRKRSEEPLRSVVGAAWSLSRAVRVP